MCARSEKKPEWKGTPPMQVIEKATKAELQKLPESSRSGGLAAALLLLARRLDAAPPDTTAVLLVRELRIGLAALHGGSGDDVGSDVERFLEQLATPAFRGPGDCPGALR